MTITFDIQDIFLCEHLTEIANELGRTVSEQARIIVEDALTPKEMGEK